MLKAAKNWDFFEISRLMSQILLVDDNAIQAATRKAILARAGRNVHIAESAEVALKLLEEETFATQVALMITDHLMPEMNGPEFVRQFREKLPETPVVVLSGLAEAENEYNPNDVVFRRKPLAPEDLIQLVSQILDDSVARTA